MFSSTPLPHEFDLSDTGALTDSLVASDAYSVQQLPPENDDGNVEYKLRIKDPNPLRFQQLVGSKHRPSLDWSPMTRSILFCWHMKQDR